MGIFYKAAWLLLLTATVIAAQSEGNRTYQACGGYLTSEGSFRTPNHPNEYPSNAYCVWTIVAPNGKGILIERHEIHLEEHSTCLFDSVQYSYEDKKEVYCGRRDIGPIRIPSRSVTIIFQSDGSVNYSGFHVSFGFRNLDELFPETTTEDFTETTDGYPKGTTSGLEDCGGVLTSPGFIASPNYPSPYPRNLFCRWTIQAKEGQQILVYGHLIDIEPHSSCLHDYVEYIYDNKRERHCGYKTVYSFSTLNNTLIVEFKTDHSGSFNGFRAQFTFLDSESTTEYPTEVTTNELTTSIWSNCGGNLTSPGYIRTPNHPYPYPKSIYCEWKVYAPRGKIIVVYRHEIDIEHEESCRDDYVEYIYDGKKEKHCGSKSFNPIYTIGNELSVNFYSDSSVEQTGFSAPFNFIVPACGGNITYPGYIQTPNYPYPYPLNTFCRWTIQAPEGKIIVIQQHEIQIGEEPCDYDYVKYTYDGTEEKYCGNKTLGPISTTNNRLIVDFHSDSSRQSLGFIAEVLFEDNSTHINTTTTEAPPVCGGVVSKPGLIRTPNYPYPYPYNIICKWTIQTPPGQAIVVAKHDIDIEYHSSCGFDFVKYSSEDLNEIHCGNKSIGPFYTLSSQLIIEFQSDYSSSGTGFEANVTFVKTTCGGHFTLPGVIETPHYPYPYPSNSSCIWVILAPEEQRIKVKEHYFELEYEQNCSSDYVKYIYDDKEEKVCGKGYFPETTTQSNRLVIEFSSNHLYHFRGFSARYFFVSNSTTEEPWTTAVSNPITDEPWTTAETSPQPPSCGGYFTSETVIRTPNHPFAFPVNIYCQWTIEAPYDKSIVVNNHVLDMETSSGCIDEYVQYIFNRENFVYCGKRFINTINTNSNRLIIIFRGGYSGVRTGFAAQITFEETFTREVITETEEITTHTIVVTDEATAETTETSTETIPIWVPARNGEVPMYALPGGEEFGETVYICRISFGGNVLLGKLKRSGKDCVVSYDGYEVAISRYEVFTNPFGHVYAWQNAADGGILPGTVEGGQTLSGETLYIGQQYHNGHLLPGWLQPSKKSLSIAFDGFEITYKNYRLLVQTS